MRGVWQVRLEQQESVHAASHGLTSRFPAKYLCSRLPPFPELAFYVKELLTGRYRVGRGRGNEEARATVARPLPTVRAGPLCVHISQAHLWFITFSIPERSRGMRASNSAACGRDRGQGRGVQPGAVPHSSARVPALLRW